MKSRITIDVDFDNQHLPVIKIQSEFSHDVRDNLLKSFLHSFRHTSRWCTIQYLGHSGIGEDIGHRYQIVPITPDQLADEIKLMQAVLEEAKKPA
jgi:hypothetical protein